jgi:choline-sulfatase
MFDVPGSVRGGRPNQTADRYDRTFIEGESDTWSPYDESKGGYWKGGKHWSEVLGDEAIGFLETAKNDTDPFFMYVAFNAPHDPRQSPKKYVDMYPVENISVPENFLPEYPFCEEAGAGHKLRDEKLAPYPRTEYSIRVNRQEYYAIITHMDDQIGRILEALDESGKADNTYIIFTADHGLALGDHGFVGKQNMYDRSIRVPLFVAGPGIEAGKVIDQKVYLQDAMATSLDIAGSDAVKDVDFNSLLPLCEGKKKRGYDAVYGAYVGTQRMIRTDQYKMIIYPIANTVRLYNIKNDPEEMNDLAGDKNYKKVMDKLFKQFKELQKEVEDPLDVTEFYEKFFSRM